MTYRKVAAAGAKLRCTMGSTKSMLLPSRASTIAVENKFLATILDAQPIKNVLPFGDCKITGTACMPLLSSPWLGSVGLPLGVNAPMLPADSSLPCACGGQIFIADCNQNTVYVATAPLPQVSPASKNSDSGFFTNLAGVALGAGATALDELGQRVRKLPGAVAGAVPRAAQNVGLRALGPLSILAPLFFPESTSPNDVISRTQDNDVDERYQEYEEDFVDPREGKRGP